MGRRIPCSVESIFEKRGTLIAVFWDNTNRHYSNSEYRFFCFSLSFGLHTLTSTTIVRVRFSCNLNKLTHDSLDFETYYFGVRARALIGFVSMSYWRIIWGFIAGDNILTSLGNFATLFSSWIISRFLDYQGITVANRIKYRYATVLWSFIGQF